MAKSLPISKPTDLMFSSEEEAKRVLQEEGKKLASIARRVWLEYLASYQPKQYARTFNSYVGIEVGVVKQLGTDTWGIEVTYKNDLMYHNSVVGKGQPKGHAVMLISTGWTAKNLEKKIGVRQHFTRYKGYNYLGKVVKEYNSKKHKGISLEIQWSGKYYK